tara:strand:- start:437 stop:727 length:291 start_codon:yes stop_codon:yes gene_type:complete
MNIKKLKNQLLLLSVLFLIGCGTKDYDVRVVEKTVYKCLEEEVVEYDQEFNNKLVEELEVIETTNSSTTKIITALSDYSVLRDKIKACAKITNREK